MDIEVLEYEIKSLRNDLARTTETLGTLIMWIAQSAGSPLSIQDALKLMRQLEPKP